MRQPILVLIVLSLVATSAAAMQTEADATPTVDDSNAGITVEYRASDNGMETAGLLAGAFAFPFLDGYVPLFTVNVDQASQATPDEMRLAALMPFFEPATMPIEQATAENQAAQPVAAEVEAVREEGASTSSSTSVDNDGVETSAHAGAGNHQASQGADATVPDEDVAILGASHAETPPADEPAPDVVAAEPEPASEESYIQPNAIYAASDAVMPAPADVPEVVAASVAVATMTTTGLVFFPGARQVAFRWLRRIIGLGLFSRIAQEDVLSHGRRADLFEFIKQNPGERIENARRALAISNGSMHYHLKVLSERNLIRILRDGGLARLYPAGPKINPQPYVPAQRRRFVDLLSSRPGVTQREAATLLGISERMASYHIQTLSTQGLVEVRPEGARKRLFLRLQSAPAPSPILA